MSHAMPNTSVAPIAPAVSITGFTLPSPDSAPLVQPLNPMSSAITAPMHQNSALPTRGLLNATPTAPFIARWTVRTTPHNTLNASNGAFIGGSLKERREWSNQPTNGAADVQ